MQYWTILKVALRALSRNKLRTALTLLGMVIGVAAVIAMVSLGQGAQKLVSDQIASVGTNLIYITPGSRNTGGAQQGAGGVPTLTAQDINDIQTEVPVVKYATPLVEAGHQQLVFGDQNWSTRVEGTNEQAPEIRNYKMLEGDYFDAAAVQGAERVVVLGKTVADVLFPGGDDPTGQIIRIKQLPFRVAGVLYPKGQSATGQDQDDLALVPYTTAQNKMRHMPLLYIDMAMVTTTSEMASRVAQTQMAEILRQRHNLRASEPDDFIIRNLSDIAAAAEQTTLILTLFLGSIAAVSLIVGGIGIMNIMLVSVTQRTREIGIRMAIGARRAQIKLQFLAESVGLSLVGGVVGIMFGAMLAVVVAHALKWPFYISSLSVIISFAFSAAVGVFFGYYPACRAAALDPIEALRYE